MRLWPVRIATYHLPDLNYLFTHIIDFWLEGKLPIIFCLPLHLVLDSVFLSLTNGLHPLLVQSCSNLNAILKVFGLLARIYVTLILRVHAGTLIPFHLLDLLFVEYFQYSLLNDIHRNFVELMLGAEVNS